MLFRSNFEEAARLRDLEKRLQQELETAKEEWENSTGASLFSVNEEDIADVVAMMTGIPVNKIAEGESEKLLKMSEELRGKIIGQDEAVEQLAKAIRRARAGLKDPNRPIGSFMFLGPTGVGKTELAKVLAKYMFDSEDALIRVDMSEYMEKFTVSRLIGAPPGYVGYEEGGQLTEKVRRKPYSVILLDEIEKAHPDVFNMMLQVMEEGRLTDSFGRNIDFRNTILILTTNAGAEAIKNESGFGFQTPSDDASYESMKARVMDQIERVFRPEFLNRLDDVIIFRHLNVEDLKKVIDYELAKVRERLRERGFEIELTDQAKEFIIKQGSNLDYGARPLRRAIEQRIEDPLSEELLRGSFEGKNTILIDAFKDESGKVTRLEFKGEQREHTLEETKAGESAS